MFEQKGKEDPKNYRGIHLLYIVLNLTARVRIDGAEDDLQRLIHIFNTPSKKYNMIMSRKKKVRKHKNILYIVKLKSA